jgi:hypothetical protein
MTVLDAVLVEGDDMTEWIVDETRFISSGNKVSLRCELHLQPNPERVPSQSDIEVANHFVKVSGS